MNDIRDYIEEAVYAVKCIDIDAVERASSLCTQTVMSGGTIFICGNGGSSADAQHLAGEFVGRFRMERKGIPAIAITSNSAVITSVANDYDFSEIFARQLQALGRPGDLLIAITTSGGSLNVVKAVEEAKRKSMKVIGFTGSSDNPVAMKSDVAVKAASDQTSHVQEALFVAGHAICLAVEKAVAAGSDI